LKGKQGGTREEAPNENWIRFDYRTRGIEGEREGLRNQIGRQRGGNTTLLPEGSGNDQRGEGSIPNADT